jgi:hypothetical protein
MTNGPKINSIIELLEARNPAQLQSLRSRYPTQARLLARGLLLGDLKTHEGNEEPIYCDLARDGIDTAEREIRLILQDLPRRAAWGKRLKLIAAIASAVTSAGVISSVLLKAPPTATIVTALLNLMAAGFGLVATYVETPLFGSSSTAELVEECIRLEVETRNARTLLEQVLKEASGTCRDLIGTVNEVCAKLRRISVFGGVEIR